MLAVSASNDIQDAFLQQENEKNYSRFERACSKKKIRVYTTK